MQKPLVVCGVKVRIICLFNIVTSIDRFINKQDEQSNNMAFAGDERGYAFLCDWFDNQSQTIRKFTLTYYAAANLVNKCTTTIAIYS